MTVSHVKFANTLDWNLLKVFHEIVISKGVTAASISLSRKQSTISHALLKLESELGVRLCFRGPGGFGLTDEGQLLFEQCSPMFSRVDSIPKNMDRFSEEIHGQLKIQMISNIVCASLDEILNRYVRLYPDVELVIEIVPWEGISKAILRGSIDVGITPINARHDELQYDLLFRESHRAYCNSEHRLFGKRIRKIDRLSKEKFVLTGDDEPEQLTKFRMKHNLGHHIGGISSSLEEAKRLTIAGSGICFLPEGFTEREVRLNQLWPLTENIDALTLDIFIITHPKVPERLAIQYFSRQVTEHLEMYSGVDNGSV